MTMGLESFRGVSGNRLVLQQDRSVVNAEFSFKDRAVHFLKHGSSYRGEIHDQLRSKAFREEFRDALRKAEGEHIADLACRKAGLPPHWEASTKPMNGRQVKLVLEKVEQCRKGLMKENDAAINRVLDDPDRRADMFDQLVWLPESDRNSDELRKFIVREIKRDPGFAGKELSEADIVMLGVDAVKKFQAKREAAFREQHPGLAGFFDAHLQDQRFAGPLKPDGRTFAATLDAQLFANSDHALAGEPPQFRMVARQILDEVRSMKDLMSKMAYDPEGWQALDGELTEKMVRLADLQLALQSLAPEQGPQTDMGRALMAGLSTEIDHQTDLLLSKKGFLDDVRNNDPLSYKTVAYSNLLWAHAAGKIFDEAIEHVQLNMGGERRDEVVAMLTDKKRELITAMTTLYDNADQFGRTEAPSKSNKETHPATLGKAAAKDHLTRALSEAGLSRDRIKELTSSESLSTARRKALNENQNWTPIRRDMVVTKDGVTRTYRSVITPGSSINERFARRYNDRALGGLDEADGHAPRGVSSASKANQYHARNLKVSELHRVQGHGDGEQVTTKAKVIGHGVLDMWDIPDRTTRDTANKAGAHEVLEAAITTNDRIRTEALKRAQQRRTGEEPPPVKVVHVSVNLITPAGWRELPGFVNTSTFHDYQEQTYTKAQFEAFHANSTAGQGNDDGFVRFQIDDDRPLGDGTVKTGQGGEGRDTDIQVDVDVISFSFGINGLATGGMSAILGGWDSVYEHNHGMMEKFVGDLGTGEFGARGSRPGGFIGSVMDRLDPDNPQEAELLGKLQEQTDLVRGMFTEEAFKKGNGDTAKMGRHILALQALAEEALSMKNVVDLAATMSKGCKSDKDRGGVTDVECKHLMITEDMGGRILPDTVLEKEDQENYYVVASGSGQLENQLYNTGLAGSKEAGKLKHRIPNGIIRKLLSGLGAFASE